MTVNDILNRQNRICKVNYQDINFVNKGEVKVFIRLQFFSKVH